jgi:hypothetical protein
LIMAPPQDILGSIATRRLRNQRITSAGLRHAVDVVSWLGAVQAQEYEPAKWALGLRMRDGAVDADVDRAIDDGRILRTHVMRPTWHFVAAADIRWMVELTGPRVQQRMVPYDRHLELDARTLVRGLRIIERALRDRQYLTRLELGDQLARGGLPMTGQRLAHMAMHAETAGVICSGPRRGKKVTYALIAERAPAAAKLSRDEALATLTKAFFSSHGPATVRDFVWWSGLTTADAKRGLEIAKAKREELGGHGYWTVGRLSQPPTRDRPVHLLPIYDEYIVAYRDRDAVPHLRLGPGRSEVVIFQHALVVEGQIIGTWRTTPAGRGTVRLFPLRPLKRDEQRALAEAVRRYERFVGRA